MAPPSDTLGTPLNLTPEDLERVALLLSFTWAESTAATYGSGLLAFHVFCDGRSIPEPQRAPVPTNILLLWIAHMARAYSGSAIENYVSGLHAWHRLHGVPWRVDTTRVSDAMRAAERLAPKEAAREKRAPITVELIERIYGIINN